jgi:hypothetical protein
MKYHTVARKNSIEKCRVYYPFKRTVFYGTTPSYLQFPYMVFAVGTEWTRVAFAAEPPTSLDIPVFRPAIGNIYKGNKHSMWYACGVHPNGGIERAIRQFWESQFTQHGGKNALSQMFPEGGGKSRWIAVTKQDNAEEEILSRVSNILEKTTLGRFIGSYTHLHLEG